MPGKWCHDYLMEKEWVEGFTCSLPDGHDGPHRVEGGDPVGENNVGTDSDGRSYTWVYEWRYR